MQLVTMLGQGARCTKLFKILFLLLSTSHSFKGTRHKKRISLLKYNTIYNKIVNTKCSSDAGRDFLLSVWEAGKPCRSISWSMFGVHSWWRVSGLRQAHGGVQEQVALKKKLSMTLKAMQLEWESVARLLRDLSIFGRQEFRRLKDVFK